ncbi:TetR/AcrR family transcriptional regulator [Rhodovulum sp. PH10]|uniref:TetR/AcrR family transcriptional regulator n=1 Tax=Rhodovulum sp. PH10 TaxID=1187851 RepID=UPI00058BC628|nr:TetR/AcrR family transcriptional regulator [Rhodovulum sp. PH10]
MKQTPSQTVVSRRSRPAKSPLSREAIVEAALAILEEEGVSGLSMRNIAKRLDTGAASLYVYFANTDELHAALLDHVLAEVVLPARRGTWRDRLKALLVSYHSVLEARRGLAQLALSTIASGPNSLRIWECILALLDEGGVCAATAAWGVDLLVLYVTSIAAEQALHTTDDRGLTRVASVLAAVTADEFPHLHGLRSEMTSGDGPDRSQWAIDVIIDGLSTSRPPA